jgi:hypothetical protein
VALDLRADGLTGKEQLKPITVPEPRDTSTPGQVLQFLGTGGDMILICRRGCARPPFRKPPQPSASECFRHCSPAKLRQSFALAIVLSR